MSEVSFQVAIVGATGAVGQEIIHVLERRCFPVESLKLLASPRSCGRVLFALGRDVRVEELTPQSFEGVDLAFFSAGATRSREFVPHALKAGAVVVDNSSAYRMEEGIPLVVPEVNADDIDSQHGIIANPNCCAAILAVACWPLHREFTIRRLTVSTYQSASGAGAQAVEELYQQYRDLADDKPLTAQVFPFPLANNLFSHNSKVAANGYNDEENKLAQEIQKIFHAPDLDLIATCIRVPVARAHSESIVLDTEKPIPVERAREILEAAPGIRVVDDPEAGHFPMPAEASGELDVLVGRVRRAASDHSLALFISGDQLLKGAAWNAVQIAEHLIHHHRLTAV